LAYSLKEIGAQKVEIEKEYAGGAMTSSLLEIMWKITLKSKLSLRVGRLELK
jgi:hypothetical protein